MAPSTATTSSRRSISPPLPTACATIPPGKQAILDRMEAEMQKENLFFWPLTFFPYPPRKAPAAISRSPKYENGDLFLSWGELGVRAYAGYDPRWRSNM